MLKSIDASKFADIMKGAGVSDGVIAEFIQKKTILFDKIAPLGDFSDVKNVKKKVRKYDAILAKYMSDIDKTINSSRTPSAAVFYQQINAMEMYVVAHVSAYGRLDQQDIQRAFNFAKYITAQSVFISLGTVIAQADLCIRFVNIMKYVSGYADLQKTLLKQATDALTLIEDGLKSLSNEPARESYVAYYSIVLANYSLSGGKRVNNANNQVISEQEIHDSFIKCVDILTEAAERLYQKDEYDKYVQVALPTISTFHQIFSGLTIHEFSDQILIISTYEGACRMIAQSYILLGKSNECLKFLDAETDYIMSILKSDMMDGAKKPRAWFSMCVARASINCLKAYIFQSLINQFDTDDEKMQISNTVKSLNALAKDDLNTSLKYGVTMNDEEMKYFKELSDKATGN